MATYILAHGAWHGGWCWQKITPLLRQAGHEVLTPTLTGMGERVHLATPAVDLDTHITDIANVLTYEDVTAAVLVGHSYGGMVISGVADRVPDRIGHLVYLDAFVPRDGESMMDALPAHYATEIETQARDRGDGWQLPPDTPGAYGVTDAADIAWCAPRLVPHPMQTFRQSITLRHALPCPATYILCSEGLAFTQTADRVRGQPDWSCRDLPAGHMPMFTMPNELADLLLGIAGSVERRSTHG